MRYTYLGGVAKWKDDPMRGMQCDPVKNSHGKCVVSVKMATALVVDEEGRRHVVMRRRLRLNAPNLQRNGE